MSQSLKSALKIRCHITYLVFGVDETDSMLVDGYQQDLWVVGLSGLLQTEDKYSCVASK